MLRGGDPLGPGDSAEQFLSDGAGGLGAPDGEPSCGTNGSTDGVSTGRFLRAYPIVSSFYIHVL